MIELSQEADVWLTFVHEGAGYRNALAYYEYDINNPPTTVADIDTINIVFPNTSYPGSGGDLASGSKVRLGRFSAGTGIGWALVPNGWNGVEVGQGMRNEIFYSPLHGFVYAICERYIECLKHC